MHTIQIILGSIREGRQGQKVANWFMKQTEQRKDIKFELVDLKDYPLPLYTGGGFPSQGQYMPEAKKWAEKIGQADGYVWITAEYNHGIPGAFKNAIDHIYLEWNRKPVAIVSYGSGAGGARAAEALRLVAGELKMADVRETIVIPHVYGAFNEQGEFKEHGEGMAKAADTMLNDLAWWTKALKTARDAS